MSLRKKQINTKFEIARNSLTKIRESEFMPRTVVTKTGYGHSVVTVVNSINGKTQSPRIEYNAVIASARTAIIRKKK